MKSKFLTYGDLFCGPGGMALGAKNIQVTSKGTRHVIRPIWAIDSDSASCRTFKKNIIPYKSVIISGEQLSNYSDSNKKIIIADEIENVNIEQLPKVDIIGFGFPCNDFSNIGEKKGFEGEYGFLYKYGVQAIDTLQPEFFIAENVSGLGSTSQREALEQIISELKNAGNGYNLTFHHYHLEDYGIPQTRHRFFMVGFKDETKIFLVPEPNRRRITASDAIDKGIIYNEGPIHGSAKNHEIKYPGDIVSKRLYQTKPGENAWTADLDDDCKLNGVKGAKFSSIYKKLDPNKPAYTVTGSGGGGTSMYHWTTDRNKQRALTNRERARLQTFPDKFEFIGTQTQIKKQIGMAVPVKASEIIIKSALKSYLKIHYNNVSPNGYKYL